MINLENLFSKSECSEVCEDSGTLFWGVVKLCMVAVKTIASLKFSEIWLTAKSRHFRLVLDKAKSFVVLKDSVIRFVHKVSKDTAA
jgi:hypothetical protein